MKFNFEQKDLLGESTKRALLPDGDYIARIIDAQEQVSQAGNSMIMLMLEIKHDNIRYIIKDYLLDKFEWKLKNFCGATGLMHKFSSKELQVHDCMGRIIGVVVTNKRGNLKNKEDPNSERYPDSNSIKSYYELNKEQQSSAEPKEPESMLDDDIPF